MDAVAVTTRAAEEHATAGTDWSNAVHHMVRSLIDRVAVAKGLPAPGLTRPHVPVAEAILDELGPLDGWHILDVGEVHQQLLALTVVVGKDGRAVAKRHAAGKRGMAARGDQGAWYTPPEIAEAMCRLSIGPQLDRLDQHPDPWNVLEISAIDPAAGAGVFLIEAARLIARRFADRLAIQHVGRSHAPDTLVAKVMPEVMETCIYGVDIDPVAVDLAKAALWLEIDGQAPFTFMDRNVVVGNALDLDLPPAYAERHGEPPTAAERRAAFERREPADA
ncbi:hypothetical protein HY68_01395 [Streptomyces sp. AcH 505]|nr:hypothetical protein HY68_01395 [Streptomyces sp. AcH 505]